MTKKFFFILFLTLSAVFSTVTMTVAQTFVDESLARKIGANFMSLQTQKSNPELVLFHIETSIEGEPCLYIFNIEGGGFVIVSASKNVRPIMAYSDVNSYEGEIPHTALYFIDNYRENVIYYNKLGREIDANVANEWKSLENNELSFVKNTTTVAPLIETQWNQDCYYNEYAPYDWSGPCNRCYAGCVACAMSQVMKYWNHPARGNGSHSYVHSTYGAQSADFGNTVYNWDDMPNSIWSQNDAIATLMYHCGVSVDMNFSPSGSGAQSKDVEMAMRQYFGYCAASYKQRSNYSRDEWIDLLKSELDKSQPMYFSGSSSSGGHAIVCDGYDNNNYFHFNLGWSGYANGYYDIDDVYGYNNNEAVVMNIRPLEIRSDENDIIYVTPDGTGDGSSWENATPYLEYATAVAVDPLKQVWVKTGTYYGDVNSAEGAFKIYKNNHVYGGFAGNESPDFNLDDRDFEANPTILDGRNMNRVLFQTDHFMNYMYSIWDGFTIQNGNFGSGAGAYLCSNSRFSNCKFLNNNANGFGGAVYIISAYYENSLVKFTNCTFDGNNGSLGGALCDMMGAQLLNCRFSNNNAVTKGGAYYVFSNKESKIVNTIFDNNTAKLGGAMYNKGNITMVNCDVVGNQAVEEGGGMYNETRYSKINNSIFWGNNVAGVPGQIYGSSKFNYCAIQGGFEGGTNIIDLAMNNDGEGDNNKYPRFINPENGNYGLNQHSSCVDAGDKTVSGVTGPDYLGNQRVVNGQIDLGAIEFQAVTAVKDVDGEQFVMYPNPIDNQLVIVKDGAILAEIFNFLGQKVLSAEAYDEITINTSGLERGIYFVKVNGVTKKVVK